MNLRKILSVLLIVGLIAGFGLIISPKIVSAILIPPEVWVDDDYNSSTPGWDYDHFAKIQDGIDAVTAGGIVHVASGTYNEQIIINKSLILQGLPNAPSKPVVKAPDTVNKYKIPESSSWWEPIIFAFGGSVDGSGNVTSSVTVGVNIDGLIIDGNNRVPSSGIRASGILFRNIKDISYSKISNNVVRNMYVDGRETFGITAYGDSLVEIKGNEVSGYARCGIGANGDSVTSASSSPTPNVLIYDNKVIGPGMGVPVTWAPNGIQIGYGAKGKIYNNDVSKNGYPGTDWTGSGIIVAGSDNVEVYNNNIYDNQTGIAICGYMWHPNGVTADNTYIHNNYVYNNTYGISVQDKSNGTIIENNDIHNSSYDGIDICNFYGYYPQDTSIRYNKIYNNNQERDNTSGGIWIDEGILGDEIIIIYNNIYSNNVYGLLNTSSTNIINAENNWWGANDGPSGVGPGSGDAVSANVDYDPWLRKIESFVAKYGDVNIYFTPDSSPSARWRVTIPSKGYDTGWISFKRYTKTNNYFWGEYADTRYHLIIDFYSSGRYHIIFDDRVTGISIKIAN